MVAEYYIMYAKKGFAFFENSLDLTTNKSICKNCMVENTS